MAYSIYKSPHQMALLGGQVDSRHAGSENFEQAIEVNLLWSPFGISGQPCCMEE